MFWKIIGFSAAALTSFAFIPQIIKVVKTKSVRDVSLITLTQLLLGVALWVAYGLHLKDAVIISANAVTIFSLAILLILYFYYKGQAK
ncbi:MAG: SemiSWEET transporter [Candidatus Omnitrophota bacterium]